MSYESGWTPEDIEDALVGAHFTVATRAAAGG